MKSILLIFAHPDDESFSAGATVAKYVKLGYTVNLICATFGEKGESGPYTDITPEQLGEIRKKELENAATALGITTVDFLGYTDGGLKEVTPGEIEDILYTKILEHTPDIVITFNPSGISNHPDHIKMCYAATFAFQKYARWVRQKLSLPKAEDSEYEPKLYYTCVPESIVSYLQKQNIMPQISFDKPMHGTEDKFITTIIDCSGYLNIKKKALRMHISQTNDIDRFMSMENNPLFSQEYFIFRMHGIREIMMGKSDRVATKL